MLEFRSSCPHFLGSAMLSKRIAYGDLTASDTACRGLGRPRGPPCSLQPFRRRRRRTRTAAKTFRFPESVKLGKVTGTISVSTVTDTMERPWSPPVSSGAETKTTPDLQDVLPKHLARAQDTARSHRTVAAASGVRFQNVAQDVARGVSKLLAVLSFIPDILEMQLLRPPSQSLPKGLAAVWMKIPKTCCWQRMEEVSSTAYCLGPSSDAHHCEQCWHHFCFLQIGTIEPNSKKKLLEVPPVLPLTPVHSSKPPNLHPTWRSLGGRSRDLTFTGGVPARLAADFEPALVARLTRLRVRLLEGRGDGTDRRERRASGWVGQWCCRMDPAGRTHGCRALALSTLFGL